MTTSSLPPYLAEQAKLRRLEKARQRTAEANQGRFISPAAEADAQAFVERFYGSWEVYAEVKQRLGLSEDHAACFERYGVILQPKQIEFAVLARQARTLDGPNEIGMGGARGGAKSFALFAVVALDDCLNFPGLKALYLRLTAKTSKEQLEDLARFILRHVPSVEIKRERIDFGNGSRIVIGGFKDDRQAQTYQGIEHDVLVVEEATQLSQRTHETLHLSRRSSKLFGGVPWRPHDYYSTNPLGIGHAYFKKRFIDNERRRERGETFDPRRRFIFALVDDNKAVNAEYVQVLDELSGAEYRAYRLGDWDVSAGAYYETWREKYHVVDPLDNVRWMERLWMSLDYGFNHPNVFLLHGQDGDGIIYTLHEWVHRKTFPAEIATDVLTTLREVYGLTMADIRTVRAGSDAWNKTGLSQLTIEQQYRANGMPLSPAETAAGSRIGGAQRLNQLLGDPERGKPPRWFVTRRCPRLIETLAYLERDPNNSEDVRKVDADDQGRGGDDAENAARYGLYNPRASRVA